MESDKHRDKRIYEENLKATNVKMGGFSLDDIEIVMTQTGCTEHKAKRSLQLASGDMARAILMVTNELI